MYEEERKIEMANENFFTHRELYAKNMAGIRFLRFIFEIFKHFFIKGTILIRGVWFRVPTNFASVQKILLARKCIELSKDFTVKLFQILFFKVSNFQNEAYLRSVCVRCCSRQGIFLERIFKVLYILFYKMSIKFFKSFKSV